ncbi:uncharacterized protein C2845_PM16G02340 [Panicum miliaceum]|uniref:Uncharacterized protein n=1 Tax=Panicum miliaceum TaxID=4540 RepID=A0A3L6PUI3_PANMI|nr:uncharacterized protein C2845_PM16G02340 [Panicum miliaceum]
MAEYRLYDSPRLGGPQHTRANFCQYLGWYHSATQYKLRQKRTGDDYADISSSEDEDTSYNMRAREGTVVEIAPILDRVRRLRRAVAPCGCHCVVPTNVAVPSLSHRSRAFAASTAAASSSHRSAHQSVVANSSRTATFSDHQDDEEAEDDNANQSQDYDEIGTLQLQDAPCATQATPHRRRPPARHMPGTDALGRGKRRSKRI